MKCLSKIKNRAKKYGLVAEYVGVDTLKVHSKKYAFDSWLVKEQKDCIELWHLNKAFGNQKCTYHLQKRLEKDKWKWILQRINSHNRYSTRFVSKHQGNLVDRVLAKHNLGGVK